jgi:3-deoxy-D-manno-octulosonate 8-phosphate phosphatase (KDO 8-P phosphatase)
LSACPSDVALEVKARVHFMALFRGGFGAVRELVELVLKATGRWEKALDILGAGTLHTL